MKPDAEAIAQRLRERFPDARIEVSDDSAAHAGHAGAQGGAGHYSVLIVSGAFAGVARIGRHRLVYDVFSDWIPHRIHALAVQARTPDEAQA